MQFASISELENLLEHITQEVIVCDSTYNILICNSTTDRNIGYNRSEFIGTNLQNHLLDIPQDLIFESGVGFNSKISCKDGSSFNIHFCPFAIKIASKKAYLCIISTDTQDDEFHATATKYKQIIDFSPDSIFIHQDGKIVFMNESGLKLFGAADEQSIVGSSLWDLYPPERHGVVRARNQKMEQTGEAVPPIEHTMLRLDGSTIQVEAMACPIEYAGDLAFYVALRDRSERNKQNALLQLQHKVSKLLIESTNIVDICNKFLELICQNLTLQRGYCWLYDSEMDNLSPVAQYAMDKSINEELKARSATDGLIGQVYSAGKRVWMDYEQRLAIAVPILSGKQILGVIEFSNDIITREDEDIIDALQAFSEQIGLFIQNKNVEKNLDYLARHDPITGLSNRSFFEETLQYSIHLSQANDNKLALLFIDVDDFSLITQTIGHTNGDDLLRIIAKRLTDCIQEKSNLARFGPQFAVILESTNNINTYINQINKMFIDEILCASQKLSILLNYGVAIYPDDGSNVRDLMQAANVALDAARENGKGAIQYCSKALNSKSRSKLQMEHSLREAFLNDEFFIQYQPIIDAPSMQTSGFEALVRWRHNGILISPSEFIPLAEKTRVIIELGAWVMNTATKQCKEWSDTFKKPLCMSVNISPAQFSSQKLVTMLEEVLTQTQVDPSNLRAEITESVLVDNESIGLLHSIKDLGIKISIDDFGTGFSSLNYLRNLPIDYLKIDQSFIRNITTNTNDAAIVKTIINLAHNLNYDVIAEGVETQEQFNFLTTLGCNNIQGYFFSAPLDTSQAKEFLQAGKLLL